MKHEEIHTRILQSETKGTISKVDHHDVSDSNHNDTRSCCDIPENSERVRRNLDESMLMPLLIPER